MREWWFNAVVIRGVARIDWSGGGGPNLANVSIVGRVSVKFPCYMLLTGPEGA